MNTKILSPQQIAEAVTLLQQGEIVALPTETVYGLAADARQTPAIQKIFTAKGRPTNHPLIVHLPSLEHLTQWAVNVPPLALKLAHHVWPGPLTMVLSKNPQVSDVITGGLATVAVRIPAHPVTQALLQQLGSAIVAPSANAHKKTSPTKPEHVLCTLDGKIAAVVDGGSCQIGLESTILDFTQKTPTVLRPGTLTAAALAEMIGCEILSPKSHAARIAGNMAIHYQPQTPLLLLPLAELKIHLDQEYPCVVIHYSPLVKKQNCILRTLPNHRTEYARMLYDVLYEADRLQVKKILVEAPPADWTEVHDRLFKASAK